MFCTFCVIELIKACFGKICSSQDDLLSQKSQNGFKITQNTAMCYAYKCREEVPNIANTLCTDCTFMLHKCAISAMNRAHCIYFSLYLYSLCKISKR